MDPSLPPAPGAVPRSARAVVEDLSDRLGTSPGRLVAALVGAAVVVAVIGVVVSRPDQPPPELSIPYAEEATVEQGQASAAGPAPTTTVPELVVHAAGAVARPGVYALPGGARVGDLLAAAGGPVDGADLDRLNLAAPLLDGTRVYVPEVGEEHAPPVDGPDVLVGPATTAGTGAGGLVDLNAADEATLDTLPGVGPSTAAAIVAHREANGPFRRVEDLLDVRGIGEAKLDALRDLVSV